MIQEIIDSLMPYISAIGLSLVAVVTSFIYFLKARADKLKVVAQKDLELAQLEKEKVSLQRSIYEGTYTICPECGSKVYLKEMKFYLRDENGQEKEVSPDEETCSQ